jgi:LPS-assembly lipoprotein
MQITQVFKLSLVSILAAMLMACGFHLRGAASVPDTVKTIYIQGVNIRDEFGLHLKRNLTRNGITVVSDYREGAALMSFTRNRLERRVMTVGVQTAKVAEYELILEVEFDVSDANQNKLIENEFF